MGDKLLMPKIKKYHKWVVKVKQNITTTVQKKHIHPKFKCNDVNFLYFFIFGDMKEKSEK
jgi:hypothetical protein